MSPLFLSPATQVLNLLLPSLLSLIPDDIMERGVDALLDVIETAIATSPTPVDDALVLPLVAALRNKLNVPDRD